MLGQESDADADADDGVGTRGAVGVRSLSRVCEGATPDTLPPPTIPLPRLLGFDVKLPRFRPFVVPPSATDAFPPGGPVPALLFTNIGGNRFLDGSFRTNPMPCT